MTLRKNWPVVILGIAALMPASLCSLARKVSAQTVYGVQSQPGPTASPQVNDVDCLAAGTWTGWINVSSYRRITWDVTYDFNAGGAATFVNMRCESSTSNATVSDAGQDIHVIVSTSAAGVSTTEPDGRTTAVAGADETWSWSYSNIPAPWINCLISCTAGNANDDVTVLGRRHTP